MVSFTPPANRARRTSVAASDHSGWSARLLRVADLGIAASMLAVPLLLGGARPIGQIVLLALSFSTGVAWLLAQACNETPRWNWLGAEPLLLAAAVLVGVQLIPLPAEWLEFLSPRISELLPLWSPDAESSRLGRWETLSLAPAETLDCLATFAAYAVLLLVASQRIRSLADATRILRWVAAAAAVQAVFGLLQYFLSNGKFFWFYLHPYVSTADEVHGSFINRNHTAHFLALGIGPLLLLALDDSAAGKRSTRFSKGASGLSALLRPAAWTAVACAVLATALTMSRGGLLAMGTAAVVFVLVSRRSRSHQAALLPVLALLAVGIAAAMFVPGAERMEDRIATVASLDVDAVDHDNARRRIWDTVADGIPEFPVLGTGLGTMRYVFPLYFDEPDNRLEYTTADNGYLEIALESGLIGLALVIAALALLISRCLRGTAHAETPQHAVCQAAVLAGIAASAVHALVESNWFIPGCMVLLIPLAACGLALSGGDSTTRALPSFKVPRPIWGAAAIGLSIGLLQLLPIKQARNSDSESWAVLDPLTTDATSFDAASLDVNEWQHQLDEIGRRPSSNPRIHLALAGQYLQLFEQRQRSCENPMSLTEIRETVAEGGFESPAEVTAWLDRAFAGNVECLHAARRHAARCIEFSPMEGRAYVYLAELCFLQGGDDETRRQLIAQAQSVRPYDAQVLFAAGQYQFQQGDMEGALICWKQAYHRSRVWEAAVTNSLIHILPAEEFLAEFQPDWFALRQLRHQLKATGHPGYELILRRLAEATVERAESVEPDQAAELLVEAYDEYVELNEPQAALNCALAAVSKQPSSFEARLRAGQCLHAQGHHDQAVQELRWCLRRKPHDELAAGLLLAAIEAQTAEVSAADGDTAATSDRLESTFSGAGELAPVSATVSTADGYEAVGHRPRAAVTQADYVVSPPPME